MPLLGTLGFESQLLAVVHKGKPPLSVQVATTRAAEAAEAWVRSAAARRDWAIAERGQCFNVIMSLFFRRFDKEGALES